MNWFIVCFKLTVGAELIRHNKNTQYGLNLCHMHKYSYSYGKKQENKRHKEPVAGQSLHTEIFTVHPAVCCCCLLVSVHRFSYIFDLLEFLYLSVSFSFLYQLFVLLFILLF